MQASVDLVEVLALRNASPSARPVPAEQWLAFYELGSAVSSYTLVRLHFPTSEQTSSKATSFRLFERRSP